MNAARLSADDLLRFYAALDVARAHAATAELNERMQAAGRDYSERKAGVTYGEMWYAEDAASAAHKWLGVNRNYARRVAEAYYLPTRAAAVIEAAEAFAHELTAPMVQAASSTESPAIRIENYRAAKHRRKGRRRR
jgi:hypothetical protein